MDPFIYDPFGKGLSKPPGIINEANSCFITSVLQCLLAVAPWRECLCQAIWSTDDDELPILKALEELFIGITTCCTEPHYSCSAFLDILKEKWVDYRHGEQEDCLVFLEYVLYAVHEETLVPILMPTFMKDTTVKRTVIQAWAGRERSPVSTMFGSLSVRHTVCANNACGDSFAKCDPVSFYITLNLPPAKHSTLEDCLRMWAAEEILADSKCVRCAGQRKSSMKMGRLPPVLIVQLARFNFTAHGTHGQVNNSFVEYSHTLDMKEFVVDGLQTNTEYNLVAVTCHSGGLAQGHYTSYCCRDKKWFYFDDSRSNNTSRGRAISNAAYLLWYCLPEGPAGNLPLDGDMVPPNPNPNPNPVNPENNVNPTSPASQAPSHDSGATLVDSYEGNSSTDSEVFSLHEDEEIHIPSKPAPSKRKKLQAAPGTAAVAPNAPKGKKNISFHEEISAHNNKCNHQEISLDCRDPVLERGDVAGGNLDLAQLTFYKMPQLVRLLRIYGLSSVGVKKELISRIKAHVARGKGEKVNPAFEGGLWHQKKRARLMEPIQTDLPIVPVGNKMWNPFPSVHIPEGFHYLNILEYFEDIPEIEYSYTKGVVTPKAKELVLSLHHDSSDEEEDTEEISHEMTFQDLCRRAIRKCITKGEQFLYSGRLLSMLDTKKGSHYFIRAQVQASMEDKLYGVIIILNVSDGSICSTECSCKAQALKRCGHIAAVLLRLWLHVFTKGYEAVTTTGTQCYWRTSGDPKNPGLLREKQYESRKPLGPRVNFDPRPTAYKTDGPISDDNLKDFKEDLQKSTPTCLFLYHLDSGFIPSTVMQTQVVIDMQTDEGVLTLAEECSKLLWKLARKCRGKTGPFEVPNTFGQHLSKVWHEERALCINPSSAKTFLGLQKEITVKKYLRRKVWLIGKLETKAMKTGKKLENAARKKCEWKLQSEVHRDYKIVETGLWKNPKYPQMACSPDGIITFPGEKNKLLEIKVLTMLNYSTEASDETQEVYNTDEEEVDNPAEKENNPEETEEIQLKPVNPEKFEEEMSQEQKNSFYLRRNKEGEIELKKSHGYNYQIQMSLDLLELTECILCVYSTTGCQLVTVKYDPFFWAEKRELLLSKHRKLIIPEAILGRTKRWLPPAELMYSTFHEDPEDNYFETEPNTDDCTKN